MASAAIKSHFLAGWTSAAVGFFGALLDALQDLVSSLGGTFAPSAALEGSLATLTDQDFSMYEGDDFILQVTVKDVNGVVVNLTGLVAARWWFAHGLGQAALLQKALGSGITVVGAVNGRIDVTLVPADTAGLGGATYRHELEITDVANTVHTVVVGDMTVNQTVVV